MTEQFKICVVTTSRADYSILLPLLRRIELEEAFDLKLVVSGMHLMPEFGKTSIQIDNDGFKPVARINHIVSSDDAQGVSKSIGLGITSFADFYSQETIDFLILTGDRAEMIAAGLAAVPFRIPIAHIHGGETTEGAIDEVFRHSLTKMSHLHFATNTQHVSRIIQLGENPENVIFSGAPALDNLSDLSPMTPEELHKNYGILAEKSPILVTCHPETVGNDKNTTIIDEILTACSELKQQIVFTSANADEGGHNINQKIEFRVNQNPDWLFVKNLTPKGYYGLLNYASVMLGNSSSGLIEACSFNLPVVNIGDRQKGRLAGKNVINVHKDAQAILKAVAHAASDEFKRKIAQHQNPYFNGGASAIIVDTIKKKIRSGISLQKPFFDLSTFE